MDANQVKKVHWKTVKNGDGEFGERSKINGLIENGKQTLFLKKMCLKQNLFIRNPPTGTYRLAGKRLRHCIFFSECISGRCEYPVMDLGIACNAVHSTKPRWTIGYTAI